MKKLFSAIILTMVIIILCSCEKTMTFDNEYGVRYILDDDCYITINLDPADSKTITMITIVSSDELYGNGEGLEGYSNDSESEDHIIYNRTEEQEYIRIRFYNGITDDELSAINQYLNFNFSLRTDIHELLNSKTFFYRKILIDGEYINDISFAGNRQVK